MASFKMKYSVIREVASGKKEKGDTGPQCSRLKQLDFFFKKKQVCQELASYQVSFMLRETLNGTNY